MKFIIVLFIMCHPHMCGQLPELRGPQRPGEAPPTPVVRLGLPGVHVVLSRELSLNAAARTIARARDHRIDVDYKQQGNTWFVYIADEYPNRKRASKDLSRILDEFPAAYINAQ